MLFFRHRNNTDCHPNDLILKLSDCDTRIKCGQMGNPSEIYDLLATLNNNLMLRYERKESDGIFSRSQTLFDMTDLPDLTNSVHKWPSFLVFSNGGIERKIKGLIDWRTKGFNDTILEGKFKLVGVIFHIHLSHYTCIFQIEDKLFYYDDMSSEYASQINKSFKDIENEVFQDNIVKQPAMYFYTSFN